MSTFKKTIFLTNNSSKNKLIASLTLSLQSSKIFATFKCYDKLTDNIILGIKSDNNIIKQNIILDSDTYNFILNHNINLDNISCVLLTQEQNKLTTLAWGSIKEDNYKNYIIQELQSKMEKIKTNVIVEKTNKEIKKIETDNSPLSPILSNNPTYNQSHLDTILETEPSTEYSNEVATSSTSTLSELFESSEEEINNTIDKEIPTEHQFYNMLAEQLQELFDTYPREYNLEKLVPSSQWVKINHEEENKYYVVGLILENSDVKYICYGVPGSFYNEPPQELSGYSQWIPTDVSDPYNNGYWVMYQDSDTGENIYLK